MVGTRYLSLISSLQNMGSGIVVVVPRGKHKQCPIKKQLLARTNDHLLKVIFLGNFLDDVV